MPCSELISLVPEKRLLASAAALSDEDMIMSQYREQGALAYRGFTVEAFMDQLFSNQNELNKGRQMPIHYGSEAHHFMTISSPLGTQIPQAAGYAYGQKMTNRESVTMCYFGEGAASEGDFHAGLNMAPFPLSVRCFVATVTRYQRHLLSSSPEMVLHHAVFMVATIRVDSNDAVAVFNAVARGRELAVEEIDCFNQP